jgi:hypothetical protein
MSEKSQQMFKEAFFEQRIKEIEAAHKDLMSEVHQLKKDEKSGQNDWTKNKLILAYKKHFDVLAAEVWE